MLLSRLASRTLLISAAIVATGLVLARSGAAQNVSARASQQTTGVPIQAPANPLFLKYLDDRQHGLTFSSTTADGHSFGLLPAPVDLSHLTTQQAPFLAQAIPSTYDLRTTGKITAVRNQGSCGSGWAFSTYGSMESILAPGETHDFSENNLKNLHGFDLSPCSGGNGFMSMAYLGRWSGPVDESADPYQATDTNTSPPGLLPQKHVQDVIIISGRGSATNNDGLKSAVMTYGALQTFMYWDDSAYRSATASYYYNGSASGTNHSVTLVGWDDAYSRYNFAATPPGDGAFLIKNSWGASWGQSGYFWISYYDLNYAMSSNSYAYVGDEIVTNYNRQYSYDPLGWVDSWGYNGSATAWYANVFTAVATEQLKAVSTYVASNNSPYQIFIYTGVTSGPTSGTLAGTTTGTFNTAGYHTVTLSSPVSLTNGDKFSVVVQLTTPGFNFPIPIEDATSGYSSGATASAGQSYISSAGTSWQDTTIIIPTMNVCIKAFTGSANNPAPSITSLSPSSATAGGTAFTLTVNGSNFVSTSSVQWGGSSRTTTYVNSTQLQAAISAADISSTGTVQVTVFNPSPGGGTSGNSPFTINLVTNNPVPSISSLSPSSAIAGGTAFTLTVNGSGFISSSSVQWGGSGRTTTYVNSTQLQAAISAADISSANTVQVTVFNPSPGGGTSGNSPFTINPPNGSKSDFNLDGHSDLIWQDPATGLAQIWFMGGTQGTTYLSAAGLGTGNAWRIVGMADFNLDGHPDVIWQDLNTGAAQIWFLGGPQGNTLLGTAGISAGNPWRIAAVADCNRDGRPDLVWQDPTTGLAQIWLMGGTQGNTLLGFANVTASNPWKIVGAGDFNGDGIPDLIWQDQASGATQIWYMGGAQGNVYTGLAYLVYSNGYRIVATADFNQDGHPDVIWQDPATGASQGWLLGGAQGTTSLGTFPLSGANSWRIAGPR